MKLKKITKLFLLSAFIGAFSLAGFSQQQIGNSGFESWDNIGTNNEEPTNWNSFKTANCTLGSIICGIAKGKQVEPSTDAHSGTYSARIWTRDAGLALANGNLTLGQINMGSTTPTNTANYNFTKRSDANHSEAFTSKPDSLVAWVKFTPVNIASEARISATIHDDYDYRDPEDVDDSSHVVGKAVLNYASTSGQWQRISIPFDYDIGTSTDAQYILITFTTNKDPGGGDGGDEVLIDDLELIYNSNVVNVTPLLTQNLITNQAGSALTADEIPNAASSVTSRQWKYSTTAGGPYTNNLAGETGLTYTPQFTTAGTYYVVCETDFDGDIVVSQEVEVIVSDFIVTIAPAAVQNLIENMPGNTLTATESHTADSREWKYSTTSGSGYVSFTTPETGATYTPQFATTGTYYVVCESVAGTSVAVSNEVEIVVTPSVSNMVTISPNNTQTLIENEVGTLLTATETPSSADSREWKYSTTSGSGYVSFGTPETGATYTPQFATAGTYYVVVESDFAGDVTVSNEVEIVVDEFVVTVTPNTSQTLLENEAGTDLTVSESVTVDSREWKYSTTSGSGYVSFGTPETGATYTPLFATAGTYYVVCESVVNGVTGVSNEVEIVVDEFVVTVTPNTSQTLLENEAGTDLTVSESVTVD
ncbi:MAG: hypothetical protein WC994_10905, partial [Brumimicrobium sp.]